MRKVWIAIIIIVLLALYFIGRYNRIVVLDEQIKERWAQVENVLQRRADLIPNLVNTVKGYAAHEKEIFENVAAARSKLAGAIQKKDVGGVIAANAELTGALSRLLAIVENYPQLKANENFLELQRELAGTENRIAVERRRYNEAIRQYNSYIRRFPNNIIASAFGFQQNDKYFKAEESKKQTPVVDFSN